MDTVDRIFSLLELKGIEQKVFAKSIGTTPQVVSGWKSGDLKSYQKYLPQIAEVLDTSVDYLLTGEKKGPTAVSGDGSSEEFIRLYRQLTPEQKELVVAAMRGMTPSGG